MNAELSECTDCLIVINCGSSSLKFAVFSLDDESLLLKGLAERLGSPEAVLKFERLGESTLIPIPSASHFDALQALVTRMNGLNPRGVGHRVVHGGEDFSASVVINDEAIDAIQSSRDNQTD